MQPLPTGPTGAPYSVSSLSCPSQSLCAGVSGSAVLTSTDPTGTAAAWSVATLSTLRAVSCPSVNVCVAGAGDGAIYASIDPTGGAGAWSPTQLGEPPVCDKYACSLDPIEAVSCASEQLCAATDGSNLWSSTDPGTPSATWTKSQMPLNSGVLACPGENLCVSADAEQIDATTDPSSPSPTWIVTHLPTVTGTGDIGAPATGLLSSVSCPSTRLCVAVDYVAGYAGWLRLTDSPRSRPQCSLVEISRTNNSAIRSWPPGGGKFGASAPARDVTTWRAARRVFSMRLKLSIAGALTLPVATATLLLISAAASFALTPRGTYQRCKARNLIVRGLSVRGTPEGSLPVTNLRVIRISCSRAAAALRASSYEATPGGPLFTSPGFSCSGPVGPPPPGSKQRYYQCDRRRQRFEFLLPGFS